LLIRPECGTNTPGGRRQSVVAAICRRALAAGRGIDPEDHRHGCASSGTRDQLLADQFTQLSLAQAAEITYTGKGLELRTV
jgi:hypothetical protein